MHDEPSSIMIATGQAASADLANELALTHDVLLRTDDPAELFACAAARPPRVVVFDHSLVHADTLVSGLRLYAPETSMVFQGSSDEELTFSMIADGAHGAVRGEAELSDAVTALTRNESVVTPGVAARIIEEMTVRSRRDHGLSARLPSLTRVESEILSRRADGWSAAEIARQHDVTDRLVNVHVAQAVSKLHRHTIVERVDPVDVPVAE